MSTAKTVADKITDFVGRFTVFDLVLVVLAALAFVWAWVRAASYWRQGAIDVSDFVVDDTPKVAKAFKAELQDELGALGFEPAGSVPAGSPTVESLADVVSDSPIEQAKWIAALIKALPLPPASTKFTISGTLRDDDKKIEFLYQLTCSGPRPSVKLGTCSAPPEELASQAARQIYLEIGELAPDIYPRWARWERQAGLDAYLEGQDAMTAAPGQTFRSASQRFAVAKRHFDRAGAIDPRNMLCRLASANCEERIAGDLPEPDERARARLRALKTYLYIGRSHPEIFEPRYRASILLSAIADACGSSEIPNADLPDIGTLLKSLGTFDGDDRQELVSGLEKAARRAARRARWRLWGLWALVSEHRLRHRFEPTGRERRQLIRAIGVTSGALRLRELHRQRELDEGRQQFWPRLGRVWIEVRAPFWRPVVVWYIRPPAQLAGWTAEYNAACYYALHPRAERPFRGSGLRRIALKHLDLAMRVATRDEFPCAYAEDQDRDLTTLRTRCPTAFAQSFRRGCSEHLLVNYTPPDGLQSCTLWTWADGGSGSRRSQPSVWNVGTELTYRVPVGNESAKLHFNVTGEHDGQPFESPPWCVVPLDVDTNVWVREKDEDFSLAAPTRERDVPIGYRLDWLLPPNDPPGGSEPQ